MFAKRSFLVMLSLIAMLALWLAVLAGGDKRLPGTSQPHAAEEPTVAAPAIESAAHAAVDAGPPHSELVRELPESEATALPPAVEPAINRVLASSKYGDAVDQLGIRKPAPGFDGDIYPPQGFAPLDDGRLLVLDNAKSRLVWFGHNGRMERTLPLPPELLLPADVVVTKDGTIVVVDHEGVHTAGTVMFDSEGNVKARLPQMTNGEMTDVYAVGNDIFFGYAGIHKSIKAGDTSGSASDETPGLYDQAGIIPGRVAPDGRTSVDASVHGEDRTHLFVSALRGDLPEHVFSRLYSVGEPIRPLHSTQSDGDGIIYVIFRHGKKNALLCLDGQNGDPIGHVLLPRDNGEAWPFSQYVVLESGGLVMQQMEPNGSTYRFIDCRPS